MWVLITVQVSGHDVQWELQMPHPRVHQVLKNVWVCMLMICIKATRMDSKQWKTRTLTTNMFSAEMQVSLPDDSKTTCPCLFSKFSFKSKVLNININHPVFLGARPA
jgi:hypothetical protein